QQARRRAQQQLEAEPRQWSEQPRVYSGYTRDYLYIGPYGNTYYVPYSTAFGYTDYAYQYPAYTSPYYYPFSGGYYVQSFSRSSLFSSGGFFTSGAGFRGSRF